MKLGFVQHFLHISGNLRKKNSSSDGAEKNYVVFEMGFVSRAIVQVSLSFNVPKRKKLILPHPTRKSNSPG